MSSHRAIAALGILLASAGAGGATEIAAVMSSGIEPYAVAYESFVEACPANHWVTDLSETDIPDDRILRDILRKKPDLIVAIGSRAFQAAREATDRVPIVFLMVLERSADPRASNVAGASIRIDPEDEMEYASLLFPELRRIGVIYDPENSAHVVEEAARAAKARGLELVGREASSIAGTFQAMRDMEGEVDGWWMIPDRTTLTPETAEYLIVDCLRRGAPLIAPAKKYVEQGAHIALVPEYAGIGRTGAAVALQILAGRRPAEIGTVYAGEFRVVVNERTSREAGVSIGGVLASRVDYLGR
ncbi:MAG: ABC transporter substrate binding protein [Candidatus Eisenbacteria bacterium]